MPWAKIDDSWWCHPKVMGLSLSASGLWARALSWSCQHRRNEVPASFVRMVGASDDEVNELVDAGLWLEDEVRDDLWRIHDWHEYQERTLREKRAEAGAKGGRNSTGGGRPNKQTTSNNKQETSKGQAQEQAGARPVPSPTPTTNPIVATDVATKPASKSKRPNYSVEFDAFWDAYPRNPVNGKPGGGGTKTEAWEQWRKLDDDDQAAAAAACDPHAKALRKSDTPPKHAHRFLKLREFDDVLAAAQPRALLAAAACPNCRVPIGPQHDDLYCSELASGIQSRKAAGFA